MAAFFYEFEWDSVKAKANFSKHGVDFERAAQVFRDPLALTIPDEEHGASDVQSYLAQRAAQKGIPLGEMVNGLLKQEIQIIESVK